MSVTPKIHLTAFNDRAGQFIFVAIPNERGRFVRTDKSVALVACPICGATTGEPCKGRGNTGDGYGCTTHVLRRNAARKLFGHTLKADDVLHKIDEPRIPEAVPDEWMEAAS